MSEPKPDSGSQPSQFGNISTRTSILMEPQAVLQWYGKAIRCYLENLIGRDDAEEVVRCFAVKILRGDLAKWEGKGRFRDYIKAAVYHAAMDFHRGRRRQSREKQVEDLATFADPASAAASSTDCWLGLCRGTLLEWALESLREFQDSHADNVFYTLVRLLDEDPAATADELAQGLSRATGRKYTVDNARKQKERARHNLAGFLLDAVRQTLHEPTPEEVEEELQTLGLMPYIADFLPPDWRIRGELTAETG
jgi:DNA-directed RNA polymerase specialized sigma24 family protein